MQQVSKRNKAAILTVAVGVLLAAAASYLVLSLGGAAPGTATAARTAPSSGDDHYSVFDRPASSADVAASKAQPPGAATEEGLRLQADKARVVSRLGSRTISAVPAETGPCLTSDSPAGKTLSCAVSPGQPTPRDPVIASVSYTGSVGLVPDGVQSVTYSMTDGSEQQGSVDGNVWSAPLEASKVTFLLHGRTQSVELMPRSSLPADSRINADGVVVRRDAP